MSGGYLTVLTTDGERLTVMVGPDVELSWGMFGGFRLRVPSLEIDAGLVSWSWWPGERAS